MACPTPREPSEGQMAFGVTDGLSSAGFRRAIHLAALSYSVCTEKAVQEDRGQLRHQVPVDGSLGHAIDRTHSCGLRFRILHDLSDGFPDILKELYGYPLAGVYQCDAEMKAGWELQLIQVPALGTHQVEKSVDIKITRAQSDD